MAKKARVSDQPQRRVVRASARKSSSMAGVPTPEEIARRAYAIFEGRDGTQGSAVDDWLRAERELQESRAAAGASGRKR